MSFSDLAKKQRDLNCLLRGVSWRGRGEDRSRFCYEEMEYDLKMIDVSMLEWF